MDIGKYTITEKLGEGNFGQVFLAKDNLLDIERAIKVIKVKKPQQFIDAINEARILDKCRHKHIVDIKEIDVLLYNGAYKPCITMEYLKGGSTEQYMKNNFVTVSMAIRIVCDVLLGLEHAHNEGILHRDIKPGNIMFSDNHIAKLSDFGLAYGLETQKFVFDGYNSHLPPEVHENIAQDELSDLYSLGVTLYRLVNNIVDLIVPYTDKKELLIDIKKEKFPERKFKSHVSEKIRRIIRKSMRANRDQRYQSCLEFRQALQKIPLAINWIYINDNYWEGEYNNYKYELKLYSKRTGYFIDFLKNGRKDNNYCCTGIPDEETAKAEFFNIIQHTTHKV